MHPNAPDGNTTASGSAAADMLTSHKLFHLFNLHDFPKKTLYVPIIAIHSSDVCFTSAWNGAAGIAVGAEDHRFGTAPATP